MMKGKMSFFPHKTFWDLKDETECVCVFVSVSVCVCCIILCNLRTEEKLRDENHSAAVLKRSHSVFAALLYFDCFRGRISQYTF